MALTVDTAASTEVTPHTAAARVSALWRYPVKSMRGEALELARFDPDGVRGDRLWAVRDENADHIADARRNPVLLGATARYTRPVGPADPVPPVAITLADGRVLESTDPGVHDELGTLLGPGRAASLRARQPASDAAYYRRPLPEDGNVVPLLHEIFGVEEGGELPDLTIFPDAIWTSQTVPGSHFDAFPLLVMTDRTLESLRKLSPGSDCDVLRFRPNVFLAVDDEVPGDFPELAWVGRLLRIGSAVLRVDAACPRCVMISHPLPYAGLPADRTMLRAVHGKANHNAGVYASVVRPGVCGLDDEVEVLSAED